MATVSYDQSAAAKAGGFGWSLAVINSNPELKALFAQATATGPNGGWTTDHFVAKVRDTKWFKTHADTARQAIILQKADPATYNARVGSAAAQVTNMAGTVGARMTAAQVQQIGVESVMFGWNADQLRQHMEAFVKTVPDKAGNQQYTGGAATYQYQYQQMAGQYGVTVSPTIMGQWVRNSVMGRGTAEDVRNHMVALASSRYPALADRIKAGETLQSIADPYMQSYAKILEVNPNSISLSDKLVQGALAATDPQGKPAAKSVWQFEQDLRNDPRYMKTQQAQDASLGMAHQVLQDWGVAS
jgi:TfoX/Sxy family transcriptional regulator of competence genes